MDFKWFLLSFQGRINRKPFWLYALAVFLISFSISFIMTSAGSSDPNVASLILTLLFIWPNLAVQAKRWHDRDKSAWWVLINLVPIIGPIYALVVTGFLPGTSGDNRFGANPLSAPTLDA